MEVSALKYSGVGLHARSPLLRLQSDERLVTLIRRGNHSAFEVLVSRYSTRLLAFCRHLLGSREDAEDVLQEILAASFNAILADDRPINVRPWLYRIARNRSLNHLRRMQAIGVDSMDVHYSDHGQSTADKVHEREEFRLLVGDIQGLPETQRTALVLREMDALSYEQIAEVMETTVPSVKSLLVRARVSLAEAAEARLLSCEEVRIELGEVAEGLRRRPDPLVRRHLRSCKRCATFKDQLKQTNKALAALMPIGPLVFFKQMLFAHVTHSASAGSGATATGTGASAAGSSAVGAGAAGSTAAGAAGTTATAAGVGAVGSSAVGAGAVGSTAAGGILAGSTATGFVSAGVGALATKAAAGLAAAALVTAGAVEVSRSGPTHARRTAWHQKLANSTSGAQAGTPHGAGHHAVAATKQAQKKAAPAKTTTTDKPPTQTTTTTTSSTTTSTTTTPTTTTSSTTATTPTTSSTTPTTTTPLPGRTQTQTDPTVLTPPKQPPPPDTTPVVTPTPTSGTTTPPTGTTTVPVTPGPPPPPDGSGDTGGTGDGSGYTTPPGGSFFTP